MKLAKFRVLFLSHSFLPISPIQEHWTITHNHVPPTTFSGLLLRALLFASNPKSVYGDFLPCVIGKGLLVKLSKQGAEWTIADRGQVVKGFRPPYVEYHFKAVSLGAYSEEILRGNPPRWSYVEKYWNILKYIDRREENLLAPFKVGIKTWHFAAMDGTWRYMTYEVIKVKFDFPRSHLHGFLLFSDEDLDRRLRALSDGWFIDKSRLKTLVAVKLEEVMEPVEPTVEVAANVYALPSIERPRKPSYSFVSALLSREALTGERQDLSVEKGFLHAERSGDVNLEEKLLFMGKDGIYAVDKSWTKYLDLAKAGEGSGLGG